MSDDRNDRTEPVDTGRETAAGDQALEGEARSRRRALVILVIVVVLAVVAALVTWSVVSGPSPSADVTPSSSSSGEPTEPSASPSASASAEPGEEPAPGEVTDGVLGFDDEAPLEGSGAGDVSVALSQIEAVDGEAEGPGEIAGPSIRFTVTFTNDGDEAYSLAGVVTNIYYGEDQIPAIALRGPGGETLPEEVEAGGTATGTFIYNVPEEERGIVRITVDYEAAEPAVVFEGAGPT